MLLPRPGSLSVPSMFLCEHWMLAQGVRCWEQVVNFKLLEQDRDRASGEGEVMARDRGWWHTNKHLSCIVFRAYHLCSSSGSSIVWCPSKRAWAFVIRTKASMAEGD
ncbi:unnamed protein product [Durusdinium trenchii]|uniref:Uncharacterized protein n=1 Tax=Durusdinium trenchii TaxID=1381693 RepID=A0ABP0M781_9DINO